MLPQPTVDPVEPELLDVVAGLFPEQAASDSASPRAHQADFEEGMEGILGGAPAGARRVRVAY